MASLLRRFGTAYRIELRLLCLHWTYPLLHLLWAGLLYLLTRNMELGTAHTALEHELRLFAFSLIPLVGMFVAGASASRSDRIRFAALEATLPTGAEILFGRWLATVTALAGALLTPLAFAAAQGPSGSLWAGAPAFLLEGLLTLGFMAAIGWLVVAILGGRRWVYPLLAGIWLVMLLLTQLLRDMKIDPASATLLQVMRRDLGDFYELWGRLLQGELPYWFNLFYVAATLSLLALLALTGHRRGNGRASLVAGALALGAASGAAMAAISYASVLDDWGALADADSAYYASLLQHAQHPATTPEAVERYHVTADLSDPAHPVFDVTMTVRNRGETPLESFYLTLNRQLDVMDSSLPLERDQAWLKLTPLTPVAPGESVEVDLRYGGPILTLRRNPDGFSQWRFFTHAQGVRLSYGAVWYPMAGRQWYHFEMPVSPGWAPPFSLWTHRPARFQLQVKAPASFGAISNLRQTGPGQYEGEDASWVMLMASPTLRVETQGSLTLAAAEHNLPVLRQVVPTVEAHLATLRRFFPHTPADSALLTLLDSGHGIPNGSPPTDGHLMVYGTREMYAQATLPGDPQHGYSPAEYSLFRALAVDLFWNMDLPFEWESSINMFLWHQYLHTQGRTASESQQLDWLGRLLWALVEERGEAAAIRILERISADGSEVALLAREQQEAWLRGAANGE